ncbi:MAG: hypothetical protein AB1689_24335 [Thermodesulfobacteriota bacterium]
MRAPVRLAWAATAAAVVGVLAMLLLRAPPPERESEQRPGAPHASGVPALDEPQGDAAGVPPGRATQPDAALPEDPFADDEHNAWAGVDLERIREALPDNLYWKLSAPTKDPEVLRERQRERERWNVEYGKILSNTATEEEILAYYRERDRLYSDYIEFATYLFEHHGRDLSTRDLGLLKVAVELNLARLEEIPRQIAEANERRVAHEKAREAWLRDQSAFGAPSPSR